MNKMHKMHQSAKHCQQPQQQTLDSVTGNYRVQVGMLPYYFQTVPVLFNRQTIFPLEGVLQKLNFQGP